MLGDMRHNLQNVMFISYVGVAKLPTALAVQNLVINPLILMLFNS